MNLSFAWTAPAFIACEKTETRRFWSPRTVKMWQRAWDEGRRKHIAFEGPVFRGGKKIGEFYLTRRPRLQRLRNMTREELMREATPAKTPREFAQFVGQPLDATACVLRFVNASKFREKLNLQSTPNAGPNPLYQLVQEGSAGK